MEKISKVSNIEMDLSKKQLLNKFSKLSKAQLAQILASMDKAPEPVPAPVKKVAPAKVQKKKAQLTKEQKVARKVKMERRKISFNSC